jgi:hypothetical protein
MTIEIKYSTLVTAKQDFVETNTNAFCRKGDEGFIVNTNPFIADSKCSKKVKVVFQGRNNVVEIPLNLLEFRKK